MNARPNAAHTELYDQAPCGLATIDRRGSFLAINQTLLGWLGLEDHSGLPRFHDLLRAGDRIYWETHVAPLLDMQGNVAEIAMELAAPEGTRSVLLNARIANPGNSESRIDLAVFPAEDRRKYERELLAARRLAEASENRARDLAETLQRSLLPPTPPSIPFVDIGAAYRPAGAGNEIGGDFYDVFPVRRDQWMVVVGDVRGKGPSAAALTSMMRYVIRGAAMQTNDITEVLANLNATLMTELPGETCTAVLSLLDIISEGDVRVSVCAAGHPLPLLVTDAGDVTEIGRPGTLLGAVPEPRHEETKIGLERGSTLVLFTDGIPEGRHGDDFFGTERLRELLVRSRGLPDLAQIVADTVVEFQQGVPRDDIAVVTLRCAS